MIYVSTDVDLEELASEYDLSLYPDISSPTKGSLLMGSLYMIRKEYASRGIDFLQYIFETFPKALYFLGQQPHAGIEDEIWKNCNFIYPRHPSSPFTLYVIHAMSLLKVSL